MEDKLKQLFGESWFNLMEDYLLSQEFLQLGAKINQLRQSKTIYPSKENLFREFRELNPNEIQVVWVLNQYLDKHYCHPICCCGSYHNSNYMKAWQKELINEYPELENRFLVNGSLDWQDLNYIRQQGVFFLNTQLTDEDSIGWLHEELWKRFITEVVKALDKQQNILFVLCGPTTWKYESMITSKLTKIPHITHNDYIGSGILRKINYQLETQGKKNIEW